MCVVLKHNQALSSKTIGYNFHHLASWSLGTSAINSNAGDSGGHYTNWCMSTVYVSTVSIT